MHWLWVMIVGAAVGAFAGAIMSPVNRGVGSVTLLLAFLGHSLVKVCWGRWGLS
ncbi:hypothetical protein N574_0117745 [Lactiplantibacillus plantarum 2165]|nr:hypothetical protein N574_0117745 [Lactiplantibacillus plantarum 2165]